MTDSQRDKLRALEKKTDCDATTRTLPFSYIFFFFFSVKTRTCPSAETTLESRTDIGLNTGVGGCLAEGRNTEKIKNKTNLLTHN